MKSGKPFLTCSPDEAKRNPGEQWAYPKVPRIALHFIRATLAVWKTIGDDTSNVLANNGKLERVFRCQRYTTVNLGHELKSKAKSLGLIPRASFCELCTGGTMKSDG